jgi:hypothetical protein
MVTMAGDLGQIDHEWLRYRRAAVRPGQHAVPPCSFQYFPAILQFTGRPRAKWSGNQSLTLACRGPFD